MHHQEIETARPTIRPAHPQQGMSLLQLMALLAAIGLVASLAVPKLLSYFA